jgi:sodium pump decarboxylase gamma subunit
MSATEQLIYGLIVTLIGMAIVFIVLIALSYMLDLLKVISNRDKNQKGNKKVESIEDTTEPEIQEQVAEEDEGELIAVISAAIAAVMGSQSNIVVRSIRRVSDETPIWAKIGKQEQIFSRL